MRKKYKSQKALTAAIVLALTLGMTGTVWGAEDYWDGKTHVVDLSNYTVEGREAVSASREGTVIQAPGEVNVTFTGSPNFGIIGAISAETMGGISLGSEGTETVSIKANFSKSSDAYLHGIGAYEGQVSVKGNKITVSADSAVSDSTNESYARGINAYGGQVTVEGNDVTVSASSKGSKRAAVARGIDVSYGGQATINGGMLHITANGDNFAQGIFTRDGGGQVTVKGNDITVSASSEGENGSAGGIETLGGGQVTVNGNDVTVSSTSTGENGIARGIDPDNGGQVTINSRNLTVTAEAKYDAYGIDADGGTLTAAGQTVTITAASTKRAAAGIYAGENGRVNLSGDNMKVTATAADEAIGIYAGGVEADGKVTAEGENLFVTAQATNGTAMGLVAAERGYLTTNSRNTTVTAAAENTETGLSAGIAAESGGKVTVHNNLHINPAAADPYQTIAVAALTGGQVDINPEKTGTVTLKGNILTDNQKNTKVSVNLTGMDSAWTGNALGETSSGNLELYVADGAQWTADSSQGDQGKYTVNTLHSLNVVHGGKVQVGGTLMIGGTPQQGSPAAPLGGSALIDGTSSLTADNLVVNDQASLTVEDGARFVVNKKLSSTPEATVTLSNLAVGPKDTELLGTTNYYLGNNDWDNPKTLYAKDLTVDPSRMEITSTAGLRPGTTVRKLVLYNSFTDKEHPVNEDGSVPVVANGPVANGPAANGEPTTLINNSRKNLPLGTTLQGIGEAVQENNDVYYKVEVSPDAQPQTHGAVMAQAAGLTTVANGFDFITRAAEGMEERGVNAFVAIGGGENKYDTGSHIKTNDWHAIAGVGVKNERDNGSSTVYGIFYDYGDGQYRTFQSAGYGSGKAIYKGGGLFGKYTTPAKFYVEGSYRAGRVENTADGIFHDYFGNRYNLKTNSNYNAFHVGVGQIYTLDDNDSLDVYGKFFHTHVNGDSFNAGGEYNLDGVDSNILRVGTRWNHKKGRWNHYLGVAYEYEFDGEAKGTADGARIKSADIGGSSARFELGTNVQTGKWVLGINANAYAGEHKGFGGSLSAAYKF